MKKKVCYLVILVALLGVISINLSYNIVDSTNGTSLVQANLFALANAENNIPCNGDINYVPGRFIEAEPISGTATCTINGKLTVGGVTVEGGYEKGRNYTVNLEVKNCSGKAKLSCCDQRQVGVRVL